MKNSKKKTNLKLTQAIMAKSLLGVRDVLEGEIEFCKMVLEKELNHNDMDTACQFALEIDVYKAILEQLISGNLIVKINEKEYPLIYLYNVIPAGKENDEEA